jgi:hypothetical protein
MKVNINVITTEAQKNLQEKLSKLAKEEMPFVTALTLTKTAFYIKTDMEGVIVRNFKNPNAYTRNSIYAKYATKSNQEAVVNIKNVNGKGTSAAQYLLAEVFGGKRHAKRSEVLLRSIGIMHDDETWVPGSGIRTDSGGNVTGGQMQQILSALGAQSDRYQNSTDNSKKKNKTVADIYFAQYGPNVRGVFKAGPKRSASMLLRFVPYVPSYSVKLPFNKIAQSSANRHYEKAFNEAVNKVLKKS